jgi:hypothetical protein
MEQRRVRLVDARDAMAGGVVARTFRVARSNGDDLDAADAAARADQRDGCDRSRAERADA